MNKRNFTVQDYFGRCLCPEGEERFVLVTNKTREGAGLWERCKNCGLVVNRSGIPKDMIKAYYNHDYQMTHSFSQEKTITPKEHYDLALISMLPVAKYLAPMIEPWMRVLDIGAATGELLNQIKDKAGYCLGIELNEQYCHFMRNELGIDATSQDYFALKFDEGFDLIIINGTIDHMYNSLGVIKKIAYDLKPGGKLYIQTPNDEQALKRYLPEPNREAFQNFMYQKAHYYSFSQETLRKALEIAGFKVLDTFSSHDYSLKNFLYWYYLGAPQSNIADAKIHRRFFSNNPGFEAQMNSLLEETDRKFRAILTKEMSGELLCMLAEMKC